ncbi:hypothetical protein AFL01nite_25530 [Aeromicrobium flavum]|uniref:Uncharacterized protein n=1 Tax=Aeromicrobium flavum TaxID=416568 RepID=A0A512HXP9_9ACTN|nr:hypothetical protein [Aeromicrobium flavum]GEO90226.1 hypothetical protein AFL01nite_25530 [Aeromicrobium flavum]
MPDSTVWDLGVPAAGSVDLSVTTTITFPLKAFVATVEGVDPQRFVAQNRHWVISERLGRPFMYVPETSSATSVVRLGSITIPDDSAEVALAIAPWNGRQEWPARAFEILQVSRKLPSGRTLTTYLEGEPRP